METKPLDESQAQCGGWLKQFALHLEPAFEDRQWTTETLGDWRLSRSPSLPRLRVRRSQRTIAVVLGWVGYGDRFHAEDDEICLEPPSTLEELYHRLTGRFVLLAVSETGSVSIRVDASGQLPVVYDEYSGRVASTPTALARFRKLSVEDEVLASVERTDGTTWFPFGMVPYAGVKRLLPGQTLSLSSQTVARTPTAKEHSERAPSLVIVPILDALSSTIKSIRAQGRVKAHLTAGVDSRMVLAAAIRADVDITLTTIRGKDSGSRLDDHIARRIAKVCGLPHDSVPLLEPSQREIDDWHHRTGYCIDDAVAGLCRTEKRGFDQSTILTGACGEAGRAFFWRSSDLNEVGIEPAVLVDRLGFKRSRGLIDKAASWIDEVGPTRKRTELLDMAYIEQRLAGWAGPGVYGHAIPKPTISPFNNKMIFEQMMSLPEEFRFSGELPRSLMSAARPDLLEVPFNQATGLSRLRFPKQELKRLLPPGLTTWIRGLSRRGVEK